MSKKLENKNNIKTINFVEEPQLYLFDEVSESDNKVDEEICINKEKIRVFEAFAGYGGASLV
jgi:hypothetical protein